MGSFDREWAEVVYGPDVAAVLEVVDGWSRVGNRGSAVVWERDGVQVVMGGATGPFVRVVPAAWLNSPDGIVDCTLAGATEVDALRTVVNVARGTVTVHELWLTPAVTAHGAAAVALTAGGWPDGWAAKALTSAVREVPHESLPEGAWSLCERAALGVVYAARHAPRLTVDEQHVLAGGPSSARIVAAGRHDIAPTVAERLVSDPHPDVRAEIAGNLAVSDAIRAFAIL